MSSAGNSLWLIVPLAMSVTSSGCFAFELVEDRWAAVAVRAVRVRVPELGQDARAGRGHIGRDRQPEEPARLDEIAQDVAQARRRGLVARRGRLGQGPRLLGID